MSVRWDVPLEEAVQTVAMLQEAAEAEGQDFRILDVGGAIKPLVFATHVIDILPHYNRAWSGYIPGEASRGAERFTEDTWTQQDMCVLPWPYATDQFDFVWCSQTVEDLRDPIAVISEMVRVGKIGFINTVDRNFESQLNVESPNFAGYMHHRWLIERAEHGLQFTFKYPQLHLMPEYRPAPTGKRFLDVWWQGTLEAYEYIPMSPEAIHDFLFNYAEETRHAAQP